MGQVWQDGDTLVKGLIKEDALKELSIAPVCLAPGKTSISHSHTIVEEISIFKSGQGQIQIEDEFFDVCAGSVAVAPAGQFHSVCNTGDGNLEYVVVFNSNVDPDKVIAKNRAQHFGLEERPGYYDILSKISAGEACGAKAFKCWAETTENAELAGVLTQIAIREAEHSAAFEKRLCELGHAVDFDDVDDFSKELFACLESSASDLDKLERFKDDPDSKDLLGMIFRDKEIDPVTGALMGRFIAEERDSVRMLQNCYDQLCDADAGSSTEATPSSVTLDQVCEAVTSLTGLVNELKDEVAALKAPVKSASKSKAAPKKRTSRSKA